MQEYIPRELEAAIHPWLGDPKILVIKGVRQAGKTTLLKKIEKDLNSKGQTT